MALSPSLLNLCDIFHVSQLWKKIPDLSHIIQIDDVQVRKNLILEALSVRIEDQEVKQLRGKEIALVKVVWGGTAGGSLTWELESWMRKSYLEFCTTGNFRGRKFFEVGDSCNTSTSYLSKLFNCLCDLVII